MAKRSEETAAAKAKKQKIVLIVGGVLLLAVVGIQGPKLLKGGGSSAAAPVAPAAAEAARSAAAPTAAVAVVSSTKGAAVVAGVSLPRAAVVKPETSQLASFTLFEAKDPFVQQAGTDTTDATGSAPATAETPPAAAAGAEPSASGSPAGTTPAAPAPPIVYATINFSGKPQQLKVKDTFPTDDPLFVLRSVAKKQAKITVAGGTFDGGEPVTLKLGKKVTLVNTATGVRYELKLVYTGAQPEVIEGFTTEPSTEPTVGSTVDAATGTTTK